MKKTVYFFVVFLLLCGACKREQVRLSGKFENANKRYLLLNKIEPDGVVFLDTILLLNGNFSHTFAEETVGLYGLKYDDTTSLFFIAQTADRLEFSGNARNFNTTYEVRGSEETQLFLEAIHRLNQFYSKTREWDAISYQEGYEQLLDSLYNQEFNAHKEYLTQIISQHKGKLISLLVFDQKIRGNAFFDAQKDRALLQEIYTALRKNYPKNVYVEYLNERLENQ